MAGKQGTSPTGGIKQKAEPRTSQQQINSFFADRHPENKTKPLVTEVKSELMKMNIEKPAETFEKERFSLSRFNDWIDRTLQDVDRCAWELGPKTLAVVNELVDKYSKLIICSNVRKEPEPELCQPRKYSTRASKSKPEVKIIKSESQPSGSTTLSSEDQMRDLKRLVLKTLAKFLIVSFQYSWENKYKPSNLGEVLNRTVAEQIKSWFQGFFQNKSESDKRKQEKKKSNDSEEEDLEAELLDIEELVSARAAQKTAQSFLQYDPFEEDNSLPKLQKTYNCLVLVGRPGVGKTSTLEAICNAEGFTLKVIDCIMFENFQEIKRAYREAVKSMVVENKHSGSAINKASESSKPGNSIASFFAAKKPEQRNTVLASLLNPTQSTQSQHPDSPPSLLNSGQKDKSTADTSVAPRKTEAQSDLQQGGSWSAANEHKVFLLQNVDRFFSCPEHNDKVLKSMIEFFEYSQFPFVLELTKSGRNLLGDGIAQTDVVEVVRPPTAAVVKALGVISEVEGLKRYPTVRKFARHKDGDSTVPVPNGYDQIINSALKAFETCLEIELGSESPKLHGLCISELESLVQAYDFNVVALGTYLAHHSLQPNNKLFTRVASGLTSLVSPALVDEYKIKPDLKHEVKLALPELEMLQKYPSLARCITCPSIENAEAVLKCFMNQLTCLAEHSDLQSFISGESDPAGVSFDFLEAQEQIYLNMLSGQIKEELGRIWQRKPYQEPEFFNLLRYLKESVPTVNHPQGAMLRNRPKEQVNPLKLFLESTKPGQEDVTRLCRNLFKRFQSRPVRGSEVPAQSNQGEQKPSPKQLKRRNRLLSDEDSEPDG